VTAADTSLLLREAADRVRRSGEYAPPLRFWHVLGDWLDAAAGREQDRVEQCAAAGVDMAEPQPGDEVHAAVALARAWTDTG
jgi:hypothetical protein